MHFHKLIIKCIRKLKREIQLSFSIIIENKRNHLCVYTVDKTFMIIENDIFLKHEIAKKVSCNFYIQKGKEKLEKEKYINSHGSVEKNSNT